MRMTILVISILAAGGCSFDTSALGSFASHDADTPDAGTPDVSVTDSGREASVKPDATSDTFVQQDANGDTAVQTDGPAQDDAPPPQDDAGQPDDAPPPQQDSAPSDGPVTCTSLVASYDPSLIGTGTTKIRYCNGLVMGDGGVITVPLDISVSTPSITLGGEGIEIWCSRVDGTTVPPLSCTGQCSDGAWSTGPCQDLPSTRLSGCHAHGTCNDPPHP